MELFDRIGTFYIPLKLHLDQPKAVRDLLVQCRILRCEFLHDRSGYYYTAWSAEFAEVKRGEAAPEYEVSQHVNVTAHEVRLWFVPKGQGTSSVVSSPPVSAGEG